MSDFLSYGTGELLESLLQGYAVIAVDVFYNYIAYAVAKGVFDLADVFPDTLLACEGIVDVDLGYVHEGGWVYGADVDVLHLFDCHV